MPMERIPRRQVGDTVPRDEVEEGQTYVYDWNPYGWAIDNEGMEGRVLVTVTDVSDISGDIKMQTQSRETLTDLGEGRRQVMGSAEHTEAVPDWTDVGHGGRFHQRLLSADK